MRIQLFFPLTAFCVLLGCTAPGVVQLSGDTYMVSRMSAAGAFANTAKLKADVIKEANAFAESKGKVAVALASTETPAVPGRMPSFEYQFRLVDKDSPEASGSALVARPDVVIEHNHNGGRPAAPAPVAPAPTAKPDLYSELVKLEDLKKRGILTEQEFDAAKKRLLSGQ